MTSPLMKMSAVAESGFVEKTRKPARPAGPRKRAPATPAVATDPVTPYVRLAFVALVVLVAASAGAAFPFLRGNDSPQTGALAGVSAETLTSFASSHDGPVYWVGPMAARKLELTSTTAGTFVRYLPLTAFGNSARAITVGTYPMRNAYATVVGRAKTTQMTSREAAGGGLAVWSKTRPTSVSLAFPGVPYLVEVYSPDADQARTLALSGRIRPVS
jgi:hypothetical protein